MEASKWGRLAEVVLFYGLVITISWKRHVFWTFSFLSASRHGKALMYMSSKSDLERNGVDTSNLLAMFDLTGEEVQDIKLLLVDIIDGYHRFGALMLIR